MNRISGEWRGHYSYRGVPELGDSFTAFFSESGDKLEGRIIDDNGPGAALVTGSFSFPSLSFTKRYVSPGPVRDVEEVKGGKIITLYVFDAPVDYEGSMSADGKTLRGTWVIFQGGFATSTGAWTAHRVEEDEVSKSQHVQTEVNQPDLVDQDQ